MGLGSALLLRVLTEVTLRADGALILFECIDIWLLSSIISLSLNIKFLSSLPIKGLLYGLYFTSRLAFSFAILFNYPLRLGVLEYYNYRRSLLAIDYYFSGMGGREDSRWFFSEGGSDL